MLVSLVYAGDWRASLTRDTTNRVAICAIEIEEYVERPCALTFLGSSEHSVDLDEFARLMRLTAGSVSELRHS